MNVLQNVILNFWNVEGISGEKKTVVIKDITEITEYKLDEEINGFKFAQGPERESKCYTERN